MGKPFRRRRVPWAPRRARRAGSGLRGRLGERPLRNVPAHKPLGASRGGDGAAPSEPPTRREAVCPAPRLARRLLSHAPGERGRCPNLRAWPCRVGRGASRGSAAPRQRTPFPQPPPRLARRPPTVSGSIPAPASPLSWGFRQRALPRPDPLPSSGGLETGSGEGRGKGRCPRVRTVQAGCLSRDCGKGHCLSGRSRRGSEEDRGSGRCQGCPVLLSIHLTSLPCTQVTLAEDPSPALAC